MLSEAQDLTFCPKVGQDWKFNFPAKRCIERFLSAAEECEGCQQGAWLFAERWMEEKK